MKEGGRGQVAAAVTSTIGLTVLPHALETFMQRMPEARISLTEDAPPIALEKLRSGALDFIVTNAPEEGLPGDFDQQPLFLMQLTVSARNAHPLRHARSLRDLRDQRWIVPSLNRTYFNRLFDAAGLDPPAMVLGCEPFGIAVHLASRMDLLLLVSTPAHELELRPRGLCPLELRERLPAVCVSVVTLRNARLTPAARTLVECLGAAPLPAGLKRASPRAGADAAAVVFRTRPPAQRIARNGSQL